MPKMRCCFKQTKAQDSGVTSTNFVTGYSRWCTRTVTGYSSILRLFSFPKNRSQNGTGERIGRFHWGIPPEDWLIECGHMTAIYYEGLQHHAELSEIHIRVKIRFWVVKFENIHNWYTCESTRHWTLDIVLSKIWPWMSTLLLVTALAHIFQQSIFFIPIH